MANAKRRAATATKSAAKTGTKKSPASAAKTTKVTKSAKPPTAAKKAKASKAGARENRALPVVALVGATGAGITTLARRLAGDATWTSNGARCTVGGVEVELRDVAGLRGDVHDDDRASTARLDRLFAALGEANVIVTVIDRSDLDAERLGGRVDRWIYGAWLDLEKRVVPVFNKQDRPADSATLGRLREAWPEAIETSATGGEGVDALAQRIARAVVDTREPREDAPLVEGSLVELQLALIERTKARTFDGAEIAATLRAWVADGTVSAVHFLREGAATLARDGLVRADDGLRFLGSIARDAWDADTLHVVTRQRARVAKRLTALGAVEVEQAEPSVVCARWNIDDLASISAKDAPSVQRVQLEIVRRGGYNAFRGDRIAAWLMGHPDPWKAVAFGRLRTMLRERGRVTECFTRFNTALELAYDDWNADHLWIVARDPSAAELLRFMAETHWFADEISTLSEQDAQRVCAVEAPAQVLEFWWD